LSFAQLKTDVLVIGGGASGVMAGIQAARLGVKVTIIEEEAWLGGMLTSAGVSAIDGNHHLQVVFGQNSKMHFSNIMVQQQPCKQVG
jgi:NADPH-dependent 2,4-dienoyl-CoA reductase/sulfur reductase-like enzyme